MHTPGKLLLSLAIATSLALSPSAFAQTGPAAQPEKGGAASWENLRMLTPGQKIEVVQNDRKWSGPFVSFSDESVSFKASGADKMVLRADVLRVSRHGGKRGRNALIGAAVGAGAGVGIGAAAGGCKSNTLGPCLGRGVAAGALGAAGAVIGGVIGVLIPGNTVVYRATGR